VRLGIGDNDETYPHANLVSKTPTPMNTEVRRLFAFPPSTRSTRQVQLRTPFGQRAFLNAQGRRHSPVRPTKLVQFDESAYLFSAELWGVHNQENGSSPFRLIVIPLMHNAFTHAATLPVPPQCGHGLIGGTKG
jgi:hypothetical protein